MKRTSQIKTLGLLFATLLTLSGCSVSQVNLKPTSDASFEKGYIPVRDGKIFYQKKGQGTPLLIVHGGPGMNSSYFMPYMDELAKDHEIIFYDQRGSGKSLETPLDANHINIGQFVEDMDRVRNHLGFEKVVVMGHSWGGLLALEYGVHHPNHVSALVLVDTAPADHTGQKAFLDVLTKRIEPLGDEVKPIFSPEEMAKLDEAEIQRLYLKVFSIYLMNPEDINKVNLEITKASAISGGKVLGEMTKSYWLAPHVDLFPRLKTLKIPTLVVQGENDLIPLWTAQVIKYAVPHSEIVILKNCGHCPFVEVPDLFFPEVRKFLQRLEGMGK